MAVLVGPLLPATSATLANKVLLPVRVTLALKLVTPLTTLALAATQVMPLSTET